jgi:hypothetical protein
MVTRKPASTLHQVAPAAPAAPNDLLADLREIYKNLDAIDTANMSPAQQQAWFDQYTKTRQAIMVLETQSLAAINKQLGSIADNVTQAIDDCEKALHGVQEAAVVMQTVATALTAIAKIAVLLA